MNPTFINPLPGVPNVESPFFDEIFADADPELKIIASQLNTQGYAVIDLGVDNFDNTADAIINNLGKHFSEEAWARCKDGVGGNLRVQDAWRFDENVKRLACNPKLISLLSKLYGRRAHAFQTLNFPIGTEQHFHTDSLHFSSNPERFMCGVWIALEDITMDNGPLVYYPGSHSWPIYTNEHIGQCANQLEKLPTQDLYQDMWMALVKSKKATPQHFLAKKGQALIWASNLLHGGSRQLNRDLTRWSQVTHYFFENCSYYTPMQSDPFYGKIAFRQSQNIETEEFMQHKYSGFQIPEAFIKATAADTDTNTAVASDREFDPELYLLVNDDVAKAGVNPFEHYMRYGKSEGRRLRP